MRRILYWVCFLLVCSCAKEPKLELNLSGAPVDSGIYVIDSSQSDAYCTFDLIENSGCWNRELTVYEDCRYNLLFTRYNNAGQVQMLPIRFLCQTAGFYGCLETHLSVR